MDFEAFFDGYVTCALWSSTDNRDDTGGRPLDEYEGTLTKRALATMRRDCRVFLTPEVRTMLDVSEWGDAQAGHDFWLTRNSHGAGFWDRGKGEIGRKLTDAAHAYGPCDLYVSRKRIHVA